LDKKGVGGAVKPGDLNHLTRNEMAGSSWVDDILPELSGDGRGHENEGKYGLKKHGLEKLW